ncbi:APC family permease [Lacticaseibacillus camelliae]|uniref:Amino acid transporter n=1 Tax=Lacticaseibacillus camelliae DSM 22697 = JCM 13995 TaxID=1423730 RepID=A0A0R2F116_9LACO|nr:amino acid permease [Lacticaseibacillus camelliae]KRN22255.1 amino acid transporter [Lacticaseibacillus camelliae DSM 22697 = JCM 13995]
MSKPSFWQRITHKPDVESTLNADHQLARTLTTRDLIALGIGAVIGTGIFILPGTVAATTSGPAITLAFVLAAVVCSLAAMCYAEFASALPVAGSAYAYGSIVFGQLVGWVIGWALILEYMLAVAVVSTSFSAYFASLISGFGLHLPQAISGAFDPAHGTYINLIAVLVILLIGSMLSRGMNTSMAVNRAMVLVKLLIIGIFVVVGAFYIKPVNWHPFMPFGVKGILAGASLVFFAYLGFDAVSASAPEVKKPQKTLPRGIIGTLIIATILYVLVAIVLTGMVKYTHLNVADPVSFALNFIHQPQLAGIIAVGALAGMFTMMVTMIYSSSRLVYAIGRDGLLPKWFGEVKNQLPHHALTTVTIVIAVLGGLVPLTQLVNLVNIGTLIAFAIVSLGILPLRKHEQIHNPGFKVPGYPVVPVVSFLFCLLLMSQLSKETWMMSLIWFGIGLLIYFAYGFRHGK